VEVWTYHQEVWALALLSNSATQALYVPLGREMMVKKSRECHPKIYHFGVLSTSN
jgi:hypothetical protein